jgi:hypothetical protein
MQQPRLSILIPSIPSRFERARALYDRIMALVGDKDIEVLMLTDNKKRSIGLKREALKNQSRGKYFMFVDDDDDLLDLEHLYAAAENEVDVVTFRQRCLNEDGSTFEVNFLLGQKEIERKDDGKGRYLDMKRPPFHVCAWNQKFKRFAYPDVSYGEDWEWARKAIANASTEIHLDTVVHSYNFDPRVTEASTESNPVWQNPNVSKPVIRDGQEYRAIVNLATDTPRYVQGQNRLAKSLIQVADQYGDRFSVHLHVGEDAVGAPRHSDNPYAFKVHAIRKLRDMGYRQVFWLDASVVAVKSLDPLWKRLGERGVFMETAGHWAGTWCNDYTLKYFGMTRQEAMQVPMFAAGYIGIDFSNPVGQEFFAHWNEAMLNGCFKGGWEDHRHDMTCASLIAHKMGITSLYGEGGEFFAYIGQAYGEPKPSAVCHLIGL